ncbi:hypothetical protein EDB83DRAFT_2653035 [Lactarius deliciosus]|nr:hypothetical protein EDB83DRAFT_2653035 [Lactarius deliciosus]
MFYVDSAATSADSQKQSSGETPLPDVVPNTLEAEPSFVPPIDVRPARRAPNPTPTTSALPPPVAVPLGGKAASESESQTAKAPLPRRLPPRRAERNRTTTPSGLGDDAGVVEASLTPAPPPDASQLPTPVSQVSRLPPRRRANKGVEPSSALLSSNPEPLPSQPAQLDKYKALFDASNPDRAPSDTRRQGRERRSKHALLKRLCAVDCQRRSTVRRDAAQAERRTSTQTPKSGASEAATDRKSNALALRSPLHRPNPEQIGHRRELLKAVNSMSAAEKHEDEFDREFNQLRITNPKAKKKQDKDQIEDAVVTATTGDDGAATSRPWTRSTISATARSTLAARNQDEVKSEWKLTSIERRPTVELIVSEENDYGIGNGHHSRAPSPSAQQIQAAIKTAASAAATARGRRALTIAEDEDETIDLSIGEDQGDEMDEETLAAAPVPKTTRSKAGTRAKAPALASPAKPKKPASKASSTAAKIKAKTKASAPSAKGKGKRPALFLSDPSDEEGGDGGDVAVDDADSDGGDSALVSELVGDDRETSTLLSTAGTQIRRAAARGARKRPAAVLADPDGDSDDDAVFKGFGGRKRGRIG